MICDKSLPFNISNYKGGTTNIVLVEGAVEVTDKNEKKARLNPNDLLNIANGTIAYQKQVDVAEYISCPPFIIRDIELRS